MINRSLERALLQSSILLFKKSRAKLWTDCIYRTWCVNKKSSLLHFQHSFINRYCSSSVEEDENFEYESNYADVNFEAIAGNDTEKIKQLKLYQLEVDIMYQQGEKVPSFLRERDWKELLLLPTKTSRNRYLNFLWLNEVKKQNRKKKQEEKMIEFISKKSRGELFPEEPHIRYSLSGNTLFHRIYETQTNLFYNFRALQAMMFGNDILLDCSYCDFMNRNEISNCVKQMVYMVGENRMHKDPFHLIFCNMDRNNILYEKMKNAIPTLDEPSFPFHRTSKSYLELYPREKLVYLSPHCKEELERFNPYDVYIIGAMVDKSRGEPLSMAKAKKDNIRMAKFPLDRFLHWGFGVKSLPLNQVINIMNDLKVTGDWPIALRHIPKRKLMSDDPVTPEIREETEDRLTVKSIRDKYRRNMVYDLLLKERIK